MILKSQNKVAKLQESTCTVIPTAFYFTRWIIFFIAERGKKSTNKKFSTKKGVKK